MIKGFFLKNVASILVVTCLCSINTASADEFSDLQITGFWQGNQPFFRVTVESDGQPVDFGSTCSSSDTFVIMESDARYNQLFSMISMAFSLGTTIEVSTDTPPACAGGGYTYMIVNRVSLER